jgi:hypothetical protein
MKKFLFIFFILIILSSHVLAQRTLTLSFTDNLNPVGTSYYCYHRLGGGSSYSTADRRDLGTSHTYAWVLSAPVALGTHYWVCTAYAPDGTNPNIESGYSNEVSWQNVPAAPVLTVTVAKIAPNGKSATFTAFSNESVSWLLICNNKTYTGTGVTFTITVNNLSKNRTYAWQINASLNGSITTKTGKFST